MHLLCKNSDVKWFLAYAVFVFCLYWLLIILSWIDDQFHTVQLFLIFCIHEPSWIPPMFLFVPFFNVPGVPIIIGKFKILIFAYFVVFFNRCILSDGSSISLRRHYFCLQSLITMSTLVAFICLSVWMVKSPKVLTLWLPMAGLGWCLCHFSACCTLILRYLPMIILTDHVSLCIASVSKLTRH